MEVHATIDTGAVRRRAAVVWAVIAIAALLPALALGNAITVENALPGNPPSEWDAGVGDANSLGFTTDISVNVGGTVTFKIDTDATAYHLDIYRMGYYQGNGARKVASVPGTPLTQPAPLTNPTLGWVDCANWSASASWDVPSNAVSGIYFAKVVRDDASTGSSLIVFVVRDDGSTSDLLFQTSDATWQAYNSYGGYSLYGGSTTYPSGRASKVSYNRPFITRASPTEDFVFNAEYPMVRWLEANGYDATYTTDVDTDRLGSLIPNHKTFLSVGHDEYWSAGMRASVEAARNAGVNLAFFSGNEVYWKTRYAPDTLGTPYRTLICYKEGTLGENQCGGKCDPEPTIWTGLWRDGCGYVPANDGCRPENALSGTISWVGSTGTMQVPSDYKDLRFWRNTGIAGMTSGQTLSLAAGSLGYEWDPEQPAYASSYPPNRVLLSRTDSGGLTHHMSLYRQPGGGLVFSAGSVQWSWGLDGNHDRGGSTPNLNMQQATVNLLADMGATAGSLQSGLVAPTPIVDAAGPVSSIGFPLDRDSKPAGVAVTISGTAVDAAGGVVGGVDVSVNGGATWSRATGTASWTFVWTPPAPGSVNLRTRSVDDFGNLEVPGPGITVTVTTAPPPTCPCTIWNVATVPPSIDAGDPGGVEVGVKFRADVDGFITGIRYYKSAANGGTHTGRLWTTSGTELQSTTFAGESSSGWQQAPFPTGIAITAGQTYVASVHMPLGHYSDHIGGFTTGTDSPPLHALANGVDGPNGVYRYGTGGVYPTDSYNSSNYWVDVVLETSTGPDETPPVVVGLSPGSGASGVAVGANVSASFNEALDPTTVSGATFELRDPANAVVAATVSYGAATRTAILDPDALLGNSTTYTATIRGGATDPRIKDVAGNALASGVTWSFTTAAPPPPPPDEGPGGPILVVGAAANPFGRYFAEVLRAEGLNEFMATDLSLLTQAVLDAHQVVILGEMALGAAQVTLLSDWVNAGGTLIAMRPDAQLAGLLGVTPAGGTLSDKYLLVDNASGPGTGIVGQTIQFHGTADRYTLSGATAVATLYSDAATATPNPAVTIRDVGTNGGRAIAFTYDLARSIVYTRQGNPAWAGDERDGTGPLRSDDMFFGAKAGDVQPDWIDLGKVAIPQADEQQRLLANLILKSNLDRMPLPRFWYFPRNKKAVVIMTGDDHGAGGTAGRFDANLAASPPGCSVDDWECIRSSSYVEGAVSTLTNANVATYTAQGFETGIHFDTGCGNWTPSSLASVYTDMLATFSARFPSAPSPSSSRTHCIAWSDWATQTEIETGHGIRLDCNYYFWPPAWVQDRPGMFTGSGMPMRFARLDGSMIDCYQAATQMTDESGQSYPMTINSLLDRALGSEGYYGAFCANMHTDGAAHAGSDAIVASALARGVPVVSGRQMLAWLDGRNGSAFQSLNWNGTTRVLSFAVAVGAGARNLIGMVPTQGPIGSLTGITRDSSPVTYSTETIKGIEYAMFPAAAGSYAAQYLEDTAAPVITAVAATPSGDGRVRITWNTNEASDSRVDYGTASGTLDLNLSAATLVTSHSLELTGLATNTTYYYRVSSTDAATNTATAPVPPATNSFSTPPPVCFLDQTTAQFAAGTVGSGVYLAENSDGEVTLEPAVGAEFAGTALPSGWQALLWGGGSAVASVSGGRLTVNGARVNPEPYAGVGPGHTLEFVGTFSGAAYEHVGFGGGSHSPPGEIYNNVPWAMFSTGAGGPLQARTHNGSGLSDFIIPGSWLGAPHRFRIDWLADRVNYSIDGTLVRSEPIVVGGTMRPAIGDYIVDGGSVTTEWMRMTPYAASGTFESRVFDAGGTGNWGAAVWAAQTPAGTGLTISTHTGNTPVPDGSWSSFVALPSSGSIIGGSSRYIQYRADLATTDPTVTPALEDMQVTCTSVPDVAPPVISSVSAAPGVTTATVTWSTDEAADSRVDYGTDSGSLALNASGAAFVYAHSVALSGLLPSVTYYYRVTSKDASNNSSTSPIPPATLSFSTRVACPSDLTASDFSAGTPDANTEVALAGDGEVVLKAADSEEFSGSTLPAGWTTGSYGGSVATVGGGQLQLDGMYVDSPLGCLPGQSLEFVATFGAATYQHLGFYTGGGSFAAYILIGTSVFSDRLFARTAINPDTQIGGAELIGTPHRYRIDWHASTIDYFVDGVLKASLTAAYGGPLKATVSDYNTGGPALAVDWLRISPYPSSGTFLSRVFDGGGPTNWGVASWNALAPSGTSVAVSVRSGNTSAPDGSWSAFVPVTNGGSVGMTSRYLKYRAELATADPAHTPTLQDIAIACATCSETTPPAAIAALTAAPSGGGGGGGRTGVRLGWSGVAPGHVVDVYRKAYGDYPLYRADHGAAPTAPATPQAAEAAGWVLTGVHAANDVDTPPTRGLWHYVAFALNTCGLASPVSGPTAGTLDYLLGDVSDGFTLCAGGGEAGNRVVNTSDMSALGANYGQSFGPADDRVCLDVGPTVDYGLRSRPAPDGVLDFEDLVLYALNFEVSLPATPAARAVAAHSAASGDEVTVVAPTAVRAGERFEVALHLRGSGAIRALSSRFAWDAAVAEITDLAPAALLTASGGVALSPRPGTVDVAVLGAVGAGLAGEGDLAVVTFRALRDGDPAVRLARTVARGAGNQTIPLGAVSVAPALSYTTRIGPVFPNPFQGSLNVSFSLARESRVRLVVFDLAGRTVRHLEDGSRPAGTHIVTWDGRGDGGAGLSPGSYIVRFESGEIRQTRRVQLIR